jgi:hypothetical protein
VGLREAESPGANIRLAAASFRTKWRGAKPPRYPALFRQILNHLSQIPDILRANVKGGGAGSCRTAVA